MLGWIIEGKENARRARLTRRIIAGTALWVLELPQRPVPGKRQLARWLRAMVRRGVVRVALGTEVPAELMVRFGLQPVEVFPLRRALLPRLLDRVERQWNLELRGGAVMLRSEETDSAVWQAAQTLVHRSRYLVLRTGAGQEQLADALRCRYGMGQGWTGRAALQVCMGEETESGIPALHLGRRCRQQQKLVLCAPTVPEAEESLICALFQAEKLQIEDIEIQFVEFRA